MSSPRPLAAGIDHVLAGLGAPSVDASTTVFEAWPEAVGADLAAHCAARSIERGTLVVVVDDPAFAERLAWSEAQVVARLEALTGTGVVARLDVRVRR